MLGPEKPTVTMANEQPRRKLKQRYTRTRNGCERCRGQRRKCDERRPRCGRCVSAGADALCEYVMHVSFKDKNSQTPPNYVDPSFIRSSESLDKYPTIEFVDDGPGPRLREYSSNSTGSRYPDEKGPLNKVSKPPSSTDVAEGWPLVGRSPLSSNEVELLKFYSHHVAPWLDVYDQDKTFSHSITKLAMDSPCVLEALLQVAAVFSRRPLETVTRRSAGIFHLRAMSNPPGVESPSSALRMIACFVLARTLLFVDTIPDTWERNFHGNGAFLYFDKFDFLETTQRKIWFAFLTLILRLEIAYHLMHQVAPLYIPELKHQIQVQLGTNDATENKSQEVLDASLRCLELLIDAMSLSFPTSQTNDELTKPTVSHAARLDKWEKLMDRLHAWHTGCPSNLEPLIDLDSPEDAFPTVIFTSGAGVSSNTIYHTAMFLLLSNKPQPVSLDGQGRHLEMNSARMSPRWHAHRICGIAIHSDPDHSSCWDPVMIAAFSLAARWATDRSQQYDIINCFNRLKATGWYIDGLIIGLHDKWGTVAREMSTARDAGG
ncbi:hypothetical protein F4859DRAFT_148727 [Xylaria cf. heliscus]|nr:hypothetical protein F4859DRAFT_148727 [Xylaria cf. heliscus]